MLKDSGGRQRLLAALIAFVVSAGATIIAAVASPPSDASPAAVSSASSAAAPSASTAQAGPTRKLRIGVSYGDTLTWKSDEGLAAGLNDAVELGAGWARVDLSWNNIQPSSPERYNWQRFDRVVKAARARGLNVLPVLAYTPAWARQSSCHGGQSCPPADPALFAAFAKDAAERYAPMGVHAWEIWNEPNLSMFYAPRPDPAGYVRLLRATSTALRQAQPKAVLVMGGLAVATTSKKTGKVSPTDFLTEVSKRGANRLVDAVGYHPYNYPHLPSSTPDSDTPFERISTAKGNLVAVLDRYGTPDLPIWLTETGAPTNGPGTASDGVRITQDTTHVTEAFQAEIAADTVTASAANPHVQAMFWFADQDTGTPKDTSHRSQFYGLRRHDGTAKPAFAALRQAVTAYQRRQDQRRQD
jgi:polysaccharide biosynthesis protein PslG